MSWSLSKRLALIGVAMALFGIVLSFFQLGGIIIAMCFFGLMGGFELSAYAVRRLEVKYDIHEQTLEEVIAKKPGE